MKITVIPDVHGTHHWESAVKESTDHIVFVGDYVDSWDNRQPDQMKNLQSIFDFKKANPDKVTVLMGNHDLSYISDPWVSGHQWDYATEIWSIINYNLELFDMAFAHELFEERQIVGEGARLAHDDPLHGSSCAGERAEQPRV